MIDLQKVRNEADFIGRMLKRLGLPTDLGQAIASLAKTVRDHKHLERLLTETDAKDRQDLYDSIKPHLRFQPKPLDVYVASAGQRAEREQWPIIDEKGNLREFRPGTDANSLALAAEQAIAADLAARSVTLICDKCMRQGIYPALAGETKVSVMKRVRMAGWFHDYLATPARELCPECASKMRLRPNA